ncbi:hypothetical protein CONPUDRAFT_84841 [Coniophora puteana RWD-64-598 SS2]|uniref:Uncharacterized protein n=1 Tax=Coniophora puteana (strain RWD-64-598) TaxID=741705 RepID=A0A5M3MBI1_CONPW|nr:uncharacterized protein CONPUDRAFT_84841 [Coniophora puteana RWD-64-598 SS2]EIW76170.1 hypothetical protein CONPUDRAFT_84841 [Coniophora puteana RWD-64-598 SS2]
MSHLTHGTLSLHTPSTGSSCLTSFTMTPYTRAQDDPHTQSSSAHRLTSHSSGLLSTGPYQGVSKAFARRLNGQWLYWYHFWLVC